MAYEMLDITMRQRPVYVYKGAYFSPMHLIVQGRRRCYNSHDGALTHDLYVDDRHVTTNIRTFYTIGGELHNELDITFHVPIHKIPATIIFTINCHVVIK